MSGQSTGRLAGKAGVITGATSGLGLAVLRAMTREGASIVALGRNSERGKAAITSIEDAGGTAVYLQGDVTNENDIVAAIALCRSRFGRFDIMHNNAGDVQLKDLVQTTNEDWHKELAINLTAVFWGCKHAVLALREEGHGGAIINTGSTASFTAVAETFSYVATKTGILGITRATAMAYAAEGIRCNTLCPGDFESPLLGSFLSEASDPEAARRELAAYYPTNRLLKPEDIAGAAVFLASDDAHGVNGSELVVDDGILAKNL